MRSNDDYRKDFAKTDSISIQDSIEKKLGIIFEILLENREK